MNCERNNLKFSCNKNNCNWCYLNKNSKDKIEFLYQYRTLNKFTIMNLLSQEFRLNSPKLFNDPYDSRLLISDEEIKDGLREYLSRCKFSNDDMSLIKNFINNDDELFAIEAEKIKTIIFDKWIENSFITCFTEKFNSILMWSHYGDYHKGICMKYKKSDLQKISKTMLDKVNYSDDFINNTIEEMRNICNERDDKKLLEFIKKSIFLKSTCWSYEDEWRLLYCEDNFKGDGLNIKSPKPIAIYMGTNIKEEDRNFIERLCREKQIQLYQMKMKKDKIELFEELVEL